MVAIISTVSQFLGISPWIIWIIIILGILYIYGTWNYGKFEKLGITGPKPLPLMGNMLELIKNGFMMDIDMIKKYGRVYGYYEAVAPVVVFAEPEYIKQIAVKDFDHFVDRRKFVMNKELKRAITVVKGDDWKTIRNVMTPTFSGGKMKKMAGSICECSDRLVANLNTFAEKNEMVEIRHVVGCFTMDVVAETLFGIKIDSQANYQNEFVQKAKKAFEEFTFGNPALMITFFFPFLIDVFQQVGLTVMSKDSISFFYKKVESILHMRKGMKEKPNDFLQLLLDAHSYEAVSETADDKLSALEETSETKQWKSTKRRNEFVKHPIRAMTLTEEEIIANSLLFFLVGYETTASTVAFIMYNLSLNEDCQEKLYENVTSVLKKLNINEPNYDSISKMTYLDQVFCESLRLYPPAMRTDRTCTKECDVGPYRFVKGDIINLSIVGVQYDEEFWPNPTKYDPERFSPENRDSILPYTYMPFGVGPRACIGMRLANLEAKMAVAQIAKNFRIKRCEKTEVPLKLRKVGLTMPENGIWVRLEKRHA